MSVEEEYLQLALRLGRHVDGLVDSYYGPSEIAARVDGEPLREPAELVADAEALRADNESPYLEAQLLGLETVARKLAGEEIPYADEVKRCYGIRPTRVPERDFEAAHEALDDALPPGGTLAERYQRWREGDPVPADVLPAVLESLSEQLRERTRERFGLPEAEHTRLEFVTGEPWSAYNYYLGDLASRVAVNTDVSLTPALVAHLIAHELYPGHHTEHAWKEALLYREQGRLEESALMIGAPQSLIAEGVAELAIDMVVDDHDAFVSEALGEFGVEYDADAGRRIRRARGPLEHVVGNAALLLHEQGMTPEDAQAYVERWGLVSPKRAAHNVQFVTHPVWRSYISTYTDGHALCRDWVAGDPKRFKRLLTEQLTPADLR